MGYICSFILLFFFLLAKIVDRNSEKHLSLDKVFLIYWLLISFLGCFHLYGLFEISSLVYFLVTMGCVSFFLGYHLRNQIRRKHISKGQTDIIKNGQIVSLTKRQTVFFLKFKPIFYVILIIALFIIIRQVVLLLPIILARGMAEARGDMQLDDSLLLAGGMDVLLAYFAKPFVKAAIIVLIVNSIRTKFSFRVLLIILFSLGVYFFSEGGRAVIMDVFFALVYCLYINKDKIPNKLKKKIKKIIFLVAILPFLATIERGSDTFFSLYAYYCGSLQYLSQALQFQNLEFNDYLFGLASFQGFVKPIFGILQIFGLQKPEVLQEASDFILNAQNTVYDIAPNCPMNYFFTSFGYAYKDGGVIGVILIHFIFGLICNFVDVKESSNSAFVRWMSVKVVFFYTILFTMSYFPFGMYLHAMTIIYIFLITSNLLTRKSNGKVNKN